MRFLRGAKSERQPSFGNETVQLFARNCGGDDRSNSCQGLNVDACPQAHRLEHEDKIFRYDIARGSGGEGTSAKTAERTVDRREAGFDRGEGVREAEAARIVQMNARQRFVTNCIAHQPDEPPHRSGVRVARGVGKSDLITSGIHQPLRKTSDRFVRDGALDRAAESSREAPLEMRSAIRRYRGDHFGNCSSFLDDLVMRPSEIAQGMAFRHGQRERDLVRAGLDRRLGPAGIGHQNCDGQSGNLEGVSDDFGGVGELGKQFRGDEAADFHLADAGRGFRGDPGLLRCERHDRRDILEPVARPNLAHQNIDFRHFVPLPPRVRQLRLFVISICQMEDWCARCCSLYGDFMDQSALPLTGLKVIEFTHMVMGPAIGVILGDLGAEVIKVEPIGGDHTRRLLGSGSGYFPMFNRNKRSICLDLKDPEGVRIARELADEADIVVENFRPGTLARLGLSYDALSQSNPRLIYCSAKGFLPGPYEHRTALDEVTQMMGGLAYMTGPPGRPLRAGASVVDITGGMFGVIGILAALERRHRTGHGGEIGCSLFETTAFLVGQHMAQQGVTGQPVAPMPVRVSAWAIYDVFETLRPNEQVFVGVVSDAQWVTFCESFGLTDLGADPAYRENNQRVAARDIILPRVRELFSRIGREELVEQLERIGLPFAPITRPDELFDDPQLNAGGLLDLTLSDGRKVRLPALPLAIDGDRPALERDLPAIGEDGDSVLKALGYSDDRIAELRACGSVG